jgi:hypothetical protein
MCGGPRWQGHEWKPLNKRTQSKPVQRNHNGAVGRIAHALAAHVGIDGEIPITLTVRISPMELVLLACKSRRTGSTFNELVSEFLSGGCGSDAMVEWLSREIP